VTTSNGFICIRGLGSENLAVTAIDHPHLMLFARSRKKADEALDGLRDSVQSAHTIAWAGEELVFLPLDEQGVAMRSCELRLHDWTLEIGEGTRFSTKDDGTWYSDGKGPFHVHLRHKSGESAMLQGGLTLKGPDGAQAGNVHVRAVFSAALFDASIRFFYEPQADVLAGFTYPLFPGESQGSLTLDIVHDPLGPVGPGNTIMTATAGVQVPSALLSVDGEALSLEMLEGAGTTTAWDPVKKQAYSTPKGKWRVHASKQDTVDLMFGLSGLEYARFHPGTILDFVPDGPAFAPNFPRSGKNIAASLTSKCPLSSHPVTTAWMYVFAGEGGTGPVMEPSYFSQPVNNGLFQTNADGFLGVLDVRCAGFPPDAKPVATDKPCFPMAPYGAAMPKSGAEAEMYRNFEIELLSVARCNAIFSMNWPGSGFSWEEAGPQSLNMATMTWGGSGGLGALGGASGPSAQEAITPQGLYSIFSNQDEWLSLLLARTDAGRSRLMLANLSDQLKAAMLTNQLFLVISSRKAFEEACMVLFESLTISGWRFDLGLKDWREDTVLIVKFAERALAEMVNDLSLWSTAAAGLNNGAATQLLLQAWMKEAEPAPGTITAPEFDYFVNTVMHGDWNGVIFANVKVPPGDFPAGLQALAAGLDFESLKAHHFGVNISPVQIDGAEIHPLDSSLFGLIFYIDTQDLVYSSAPYDFKVLTLQVLFANSAIVSFASKIELLVGELFAQRSTLLNSMHGDNLILNGVMQRHGDAESYTFSEEGLNTFGMESQVLSTVAVTNAQFVTLPQEAGSTTTTARFVMGGRLSFLDHPDFDLFSFGPAEGAADGPGSLQYSNLFVSMTYQPAGPTGVSGPGGATGASGPTAQPAVREFAFQAGQMGFDLSQSVARPESLYARFPLQVTAMLQGDAATTPASLGYIGVTTPLVGRNFNGIWFGLQMGLSLGSMGGLASMAPFTATMLAAWAPSRRDYNVLLGLKLPGSAGGNKSLSIAGPLKLTIQDIGMLFNPDDQSYLMKFTNIALTLFSLRFPPGGTTNMLLFGDPDPKAAQTTLGWYAAYMKNPEKKKDGDASGGNGGRKMLASAKTPKVIEASVTKTDDCGCGRK